MAVPVGVLLLVITGSLSVLCGAADFIRSARRWRKMLGGGMRQSGIVAAAGIHVLNHHVDRLADDHARAARLADALGGLDGFTGRVRCATNMVFVEFGARDLVALSKHLEQQRIRVRGPRWVMHLDIDDEAVQRIIEGARRYHPTGE